ncbi:MAG: transcriptional regulator [Rhodobacteraceae bacterium]|nr:transcriptional regulator [Paracoccaceae bacterium]
MKATKHHISDEMLIAYSAGTLPEAFALVVAAHVSMCDGCRTTLSAFDAVGGAVLERCSAVKVSDGCLAATLARIARGDAPRRPECCKDAVLPKPVVDYVGGGLDAVRWRPISGGARQAVLCADKAATARLVYLPAGSAVPDHSHRGIELTLVLKGAFRDETGHFAPGDVETSAEELTHRPVAEPGAPCICLTATEAPLRYRSLLVRILQPFLHI